MPITQKCTVHKMTKIAIPSIHCRESSFVASSHCTWSDFLWSWAEMQWAQWEVMWCWMCHSAEGVDATRWDCLSNGSLTITCVDMVTCHFRRCDLPTQSIFYSSWADAAGFKTLWPNWMPSSYHNAIYDVVPKFRASLLSDNCKGWTECATAQGRLMPLQGLARK